MSYELCLDRVGCMNLKLSWLVDVGVVGRRGFAEFWEVTSERSRLCLLPSMSKLGVNGSWND